MSHPALSRRGFLKAASLASASLALPRIMRAQSGELPSNRLNIALIGNGLICGSHVGTLLGREDCRIVAVCDVDLAKARKMRDRVERQYGAAAPSGSYRGVDHYQFHEEVLQRDDIDAVFVTTPDHWHAAIANDAMITGKDVYCEKPLTLTVPEGRILVNTARRHGRILQTGTQQRSNASFRKAAEIVRNGLIGEIKTIRTRLGEFPAASVLPEEPIPAEFDYDRWLGPTPWRPYNAKRVLGDYGGGWRCFFEYGGRKNGDWGAHHFDIIQWALGMDNSGPVEFIPKGFEGLPYQTHVYANGVRVERVDEGLKAMIEFTGTKGTVWVSRDDYLETDPAPLATLPLRAEDVHLYVSENHHSDFFDCIRTRQRPIADVEIGHRSATVGHLSVIAEKLARPVRWDPVKEQIVGDAMAASMLDRSRRAPYGAML
jgi:predicted dehydrogenase